MKRSIVRTEDVLDVCWAIFGPGRGGRWKTLHWRAVRGRK